MVLRIPETGLQLESSAKTADTLPLQAFAITLSDTVIEDLIQCVQNGDDVRLSLGSVPSFLYGQEVHKISKTTEITDLDLYLTDHSELTQVAERLPHPTMSMFQKPQHYRYPRLAEGREVAREKAGSKTSAAGRKAPKDLPNDVENLRKNMANEQKAKREHSTKIVDASLSHPVGKRPVPKVGKGNKLLPSKGGAMTGAIGRSAPASPALSGIISPSLGPTLSGAEQGKDEARELRAPIVHQLAVRPMSFEELKSRWPNEESDFKPALDKVTEFDSARQKYNLKKMYWKELDVFKYDYDSDEERQSAIDNAIRMYDRIRMSASEPVWDRLLPKEERGKGKCLSKLLPTIAIQAAAAKTPQIKINDGNESSGSKNRDVSPSGSEGKKTVKKTGLPVSRSSSQTKKPAPKKVERKWIKKDTPPKVSPVKSAGKATSGKFKSKEFISDSDSSSEEAPLAKTVSRAKDKDADMEREKDLEKEREREREKQKARVEREKEREREDRAERLREKEREKEREKQRERVERGKERDRGEKLERQRARDKEAAAAAKPTPKSKPAAQKETVKKEVIARPATNKRSREEDDDSSSSSSTPLNKRVQRERERDPKASAPAHSSVSHKRPPSDVNSQNSSRSNHSTSNTYGGAGYTSKNKNTSPVKSSPLASSPPTNASDLDQHHQHRTQSSVDARRHERERDRSRDRSVTVANGTSINVAKKRKIEAADGDAIDHNVSSAASSSSSSSSSTSGGEKKRPRLSTNILNDARTFKKCYDVYQRLHHELSDGQFSAEDFQKKYDQLVKQRKRLEDLKKSIYSQIPRDVY